MKMRISSLVSLSFLLVTEATAQISSYEGIVFPYEALQQNSFSMTRSAAATSELSIASVINPASNAYLSSIEIFLGGNLSRAHRAIEYEFQNAQLADTKTFYLPAMTAVALPFHFRKIPAAISLSYSITNSPDLITWDMPETDGLLLEQHYFEGQIGVATFGLGLLVTPNLSIGISASQWTGRLEMSQTVPWSDNPEALMNSGNLHYNGRSYSLGAIRRAGKATFGLMLHSPFTLMKCEYNPFGIIDTFYQKFEGAIQTGSQYEFSDRLRVNADYRYQHFFKFISTQNNINFSEKYNASHQYAAGAEYKLRFFQVEAPIALAYQLSTLPKGGFDSIIISPGTWIGDEHARRQAFSLGSRYSFGPVSVSASGQLQLYSFNSNTNPPYS